MRRGGQAARIAALVTRPERRRWLTLYRDLLTADEDTGVVVIGTDERVRLWNAAAARMLGLSVTGGTPVARLALEPSVKALLSTPPQPPSGSGPDPTQAVIVAGRSLWVDRHQLQARGRSAGRAVILRDRTEVLLLNARLDAERDSTIALRARAHEADNRLHTMVSLVELGHTEQAIDFATAVLAHSQEVRESIHSTVADPVLAAVLMGKAACADEARVSLYVDPATTMPSLGLPSPDLVLLLGNLIDNAIDAAASTPPPRWVHVLARIDGGRLRLEISDSGPGVSPELVGRLFTAGWTTKHRTDPGEPHGQGLGLALVADAAGRLGGTVRVERWVGARFVVEVPLPP